MKRKTIPNSPRYDYCVDCACLFLESYEINNYPLNLYFIIDNSPYDIILYSEIMEEYDLSLADVCKKVRSPDGQTVLEDGIFTIFLNDVNTSLGRRLFTLAHELGHIWLGHLLDFEITAIPKGTKGPNIPRYQYNTLEREANVFARNILVPLSIYYKLLNKTHASLQTGFGITYEAADNRIRFIEHDYRSSRQMNLANRFIKISDKYYFKNVCNICGHGFIYKEPKYCPICGHKNTLQWGDGDKMKYQDWELDDNKRLIKCIRCQNETLIGPHCHICGAPVENRCESFLEHYGFDDYSNTGCSNNEPLPANARYCPICGYESTFFKHRLLCSWQEELEKVDAQETSSTQNGFMNIPDGIDEELPFIQSSGYMNIPDGIDEELPFN